MKYFKHIKPNDNLRYLVLTNDRFTQYKRSDSKYWMDINDYTIKTLSLWWQEINEKEAFIELL